MNRKRIVYIVIYSVVLALMLAAEIVFSYSAIALDMVPDLYIAILIGMLALLLGGAAVLLFVHRKGKWIGIARQIIACLLIAVTIAGSLFATPKLLELRRTVEHITTNALPTAYRNVYVHKDDAAKSVQDLEGYRFGALESDENCANQVVAEIEKTLGSTLSLQLYENESLLILAFAEKNIDAMIINEGQLSVWTENELYKDFDSNTRLVHSVQVDETANIQRPVENTDPEPEPEPVPDITNTPFIVYLSGMDGYSQMLRNTRSDVNILMVVNPSAKQILMVNTPRDYYIVHPWGNGGRDKLTHCGIYGIDCSIDALEKLYNTSVNYYMQINFAGFETLIDAIGGITVYSPNSFYADEGIYIYAGENQLSGKGALHFSRDRYHQAGGDNGRGQNQMKVLKAVISKVSNARTLIANYSQILKSLEGMIATNLTAEDISKLVKMQLSDMATWNVLSYAVTGYGDTETTYSMPGTASYVMRPNQNTVDYGQKLIQRVINGEILTQEDMKVPG